MSKYVMCWPRTLWAYKESLYLGHIVLFLRNLHMDLHSSWASLYSHWQYRKNLHPSSFVAFLLYGIGFLDHAWPFWLGNMESQYSFWKDASLLSCVWKFLPVCMCVCTMWMQCLWRLEDDIQFPKLVSHHVSTGNQTWIFSKSSLCS